ncbi:hypothetical protein BV898_14732 [Hypsibius exemplaris]|uniref:Inhibitor of growth protein N-terminal histone-binding domain-containing protein n=1 Tax=Hypsibius exemplaris TaxID=2072580 RepID=A0A9X6N9B2_HYPEX|nr:hypothetical protein BV898_14732 [Hypsibius exemplaris]
MAAKNTPRKRSAASDSVEREPPGKRRKNSDIVEASSSSSAVVTSPSQPSTSKARPDAAAAKTSHIIPVTSTGKNKLTRQLFEQIPFLETDPLKALEMLKKMVQESGLETLYVSVNENTARARDFSDRIAELKKNVETILHFMMGGRANEQEKIEKYKEMKTIWAKIHGLNEAKVKLTQASYDMVDRVIRRLDKELESILTEIDNGKTNASTKGPRILRAEGISQGATCAHGAACESPSHHAVVGRLADVIWMG